MQINTFLQRVWSGLGNLIYGQAIIICRQLLALDSLKSLKENMPTNLIE